MPGKFEGQGRMMSVGLEYMHKWKCFWCATEYEGHMDRNLVEAFGELFTLLQACQEVLTWKYFSLQRW
nr:unnamed protein product [Fasciola hepatica]